MSNEIIGRENIKEEVILSNEELRENYITKKCKHSKEFGSSVRRYLKIFELKYEENGMKSIFDIEIRDIQTFFDYLNNSEEYTLSYKKLVIGQAKKFIKKTIQSKKIKLINIDSEKEYTEKEMIKTFMQLQQQQQRLLIRQELLEYLNDSDNFSWRGSHYHKESGSSHENIMDIKEVKQIIDYFKEKNYPIYLMFRVLIESGTRKSELLSIDIERQNGKHISLIEDLENRKLRVVGKTGYHFYFISQELVELLKAHLEERLKKEVNTKSFFLSMQGNRYSKPMLNYHLKICLESIGLDNKNYCVHTFRKTLNTLRKRIVILDKDDNGTLITTKITNDEAKLLLNHKTTDVNLRHYTLYTDKEKLELFDKFNPYKNIRL